MIETMKRNSKAIAAAPKYVLSLFGAGYLANEQGLTGVRFTNDINKAQQFAVGFDDPAQKVAIWSAAAKRLFNCSSMQFEVVNL